MKDETVWLTQKSMASLFGVKVPAINKHLKNIFDSGELACGNIKNRSEILTLLQALPVVPAIDPNEYLYFIVRNSLYGSGIGFVDIHLLASARLLNIPIWTGNKKLREVAIGVQLSYR
ncbi:MAG: VapC toxin family PIN domain ribonuclease [Desulfobacterales bacterium]|nr:VapC toxin family PIN domain ribonuclease [Desulfobacterales bacterium]